MHRFTPRTCLARVLWLTLATFAASATAADRAAPATPPQVDEQPLVQRATLLNIASENHLLAVVEGLERMDGMRSVRRISWSSATKEAVIELTMQPHAENHWRAYLERMLSPHRKAAGPAPDGPEWFAAPDKLVRRTASFPSIASEEQALALQNVIRLLKGVKEVRVVSRSPANNAVELEVSLRADAEKAWDEFLTALHVIRGGANTSVTSRP